MKKIFDFAGMLCLLYCGANFAEQITRGYYSVNGKICDFSLFVWILFIALWGVALFRSCKGKPVLMQFTVFLSLTFAAFGLCYYYLFTGNEVEYGSRLRWLLTFEFGAVVILAVLRRWRLFFMCFAAFLLALLSPFLVFDKIFLVADILKISTFFSLLWLCSLYSGEKKAGRMLAYLGAAGVGAVILLMIGTLYFRLPGIRFYEAKITEPAKEVKVSIVIPVYNAEKVIERCLDSLRRQTLKDIEIIAVNDGSTDGTAEILARYAAHDARIRVIHQKNAYIGTARNRGLKAARGEYVGFVDNDDYVSPDYYEALYKAAKKQNADVAVTKSAQSVWQSKSFFMNVSGKKAEYVDSKEILDLAKTYSGFVWTKLYKKDFLLGNNILFATERTLWEDTFFTLELYLFVDEMAVADSGTYFHTIKERRTASSSGVKFSDELFEMMTRLKDVIRTAPTDESKRQKISAMYNKYLKRNLLGYYRVLSEEDKPQFVARCEPFFGVEQCAAAVEEYNRKYEAKGN